MEMAVVNTYFQKREEHRVTYKSGGRMRLETKKRKRVKTEPKIRWWKLKEEDGWGSEELPEDWETTAKVRDRAGKDVQQISEQQFGFMPRKSITDAIFALRVLVEKQEAELEVAEMKMLRFSLRVTRMDKIRNEQIRGTVKVEQFGDKAREARLRWFGHVLRRNSGYIGQRMLEKEKREQPKEEEEFSAGPVQMVKPDIHTLAHHLKQERLYVASEKQLIQRLNGEVLKTAEKLYRAAWIAKQQRINLDRLILTSVEASPAECCQHAKVLEDTQFVDGYKTLGFQESIYGEFVGRLRENPRLVASCLVAGERLNQEHTQGVIHTVFTSLYGNCIMQEDESYLLQVLRYLIEFELKESENPRRLLRRGTCAFSILFKLFSEGLYSAKLFLTATLHEPIMQLLVEDEDHLETDPAKLTERFTPAQQERLFGEKGSDTYRQKVQAAVEANEAKLVALVNSFIGYLKQNTYCFPQSLRWIVSQMYKTLARVERLDVSEVKTMCTDLLLTCFICPAIVNPEQYGIISDAPINEVARFNLMQVGQLLQQLAMADTDDGDPRRKSSLSKFDKSCVAAFLDVVIGGRAVETPPMSSMNLLEGLTRTVIYITHNQLLALVDFVRSVTSGDQLREEDHLALETLLASVPQSHTIKSNSLELTPSSTPQLSPATTPANKKNRLPIASSRSRSRSNIAQDSEPDASSQDSQQEVTPEEVLVISLGTSPQTVPGMMSENEVLNLQLSDGGQGDAPADETKLHGKPDKTLRFSLCSDNLEGISEGPSNRSNSVSSLDLEGESVSELGPGPSSSNGVEALQLLEHEQATTQDNLDDKLRKFEIRDMMGLTDDRDISETVSETWSTDVLGSDFDPNMDEDRLQEIAGDLPQVEEIKYLGVLLTSDGKRDHEIGRRLGQAAAIMRPLVAGYTLFDRVRSSVIREELGVEPLLLHIERSQLRLFGHLIRMPLDASQWGCTRHGLLGQDPGVVLGPSMVRTSMDPHRAGSIWMVDHSQHCSNTDAVVVVYCAGTSGSDTAVLLEKRAPYIAYLTRCRQGLQTSQAHLERLLQRVLRDKEVANRYFTTVCVRLLLEHMESKMQDFIRAFQGFTAADDKTAAVEDFLRYLYGAMAHDAIWQYASEEQLQDAQMAIERSVVTANHKALQIPEVYLKEAPWPSAQAEIRTISAYKTPRDKVQCILRMCSTIMNLLSLANEDAVPGADDFVPVLVFVLIRANPPCLLSTIQYINNFYASRLSGEECYWWMQFTAAVEFIKTIDDRKVALMLVTTEVLPSPPLSYALPLSTRLLNFINPPKHGRPKGENLLLGGGVRGNRRGGINTHLSEKKMGAGGMAGQVAPHALGLPRDTAGSKCPLQGARVAEIAF
ncbi:hypothetical protein SRHO_G00333700 [Serrasalmus rhombeus]